ncbi:hypothetical protein ACSD7O_14015 [Methylorubrum extorquens]|uniref:hypothetical protein n=1 Tax=Methylorubrum extorquens TaxID=408 RepID=UPI003F63A468
MLLLKSRATISNPAIPAFTLSDAERSLYALSPSLWLEGDTRFIQASGSGLTGWVDRMSSRRYVPGLSTSPLIVPMGTGTRRAVRMGFGDAAHTLATNGMLAPEGGFECLSASGKQTMAALLRLPKLSSNGGTETGVTNRSGGTMVGSASATSTNRYEAYIDNTNGGAIGVKQGSTFNAASSGQALQDGVWHNLLWSIDPAVNSKAIRLDGVTLTNVGQTPVAPVAEAGALQLLIGAAGSTFTTSPFLGDIGGLIVFPGLVAHTDPTALSLIETYMATMKAGFTS